MKGRKASKVDTIENWLSFRRDGFVLCSANLAAATTYPQKWLRSVFFFNPANFGGSDMSA
jgi:hypothetical protein